MEDVDMEAAGDVDDGSSIQATRAALPPTIPSIHPDDLLAGVSYSHYTPIPRLIITNVTGDAEGENSLAGTPCVLGVDEAGRGPVIGPMVYGAFYLPIELQQTLLATTHHFDDSKVLSPAVRANLMKTLCTSGSDLFDSCGWTIKSLSARDIGAGMMKNGGSYNLNAQAMDATIELIRGAVDRGVNIQEVYIDTIGSPTVYQKKLERIFPTIKIRVEKKADSLFPCVSAASVVAKVTRDISCELLYQAVVRAQGQSADAEEAGWGSGYPSDAKCVAWLKSDIEPLFGWGREARFSWGTIKDMLELKGGTAQRVEWQEDEDDGNARLSTYFGAGNDGFDDRTEARELRSWFGSRVGQEAF